jgi:hypothetical protein
MYFFKRTKFTSKVHPSLHRLIFGACEFVGHAMRMSADLPTCVMIQTTREIIRGAYSSPLYGSADAGQVIGTLTDVARSFAPERNTVALAIIYRTRITRPTGGGTLERRVLEPRPEMELVVVNAESREGEFFGIFEIQRTEEPITFEILSAVRESFVGLRELEVPLLRDATGSLASSKGIQLADQELPRKKGLGLRHPNDQVAVELDRAPQNNGRRVRKRPSRNLRNFDVRVYPLALPWSLSECQPGV